MRASLPVVVVLPEPCKPAMRITAGGWVAKSSPALASPIRRVSSRCTTPTRAWPGVRLPTTSRAHGLLLDRGDETRAPRAGRRRPQGGQRAPRAGRPGRWLRSAWPRHGWFLRCGRGGCVRLSSTGRPGFVIEWARERRRDENSAMVDAMPNLLLFLADEALYGGSWRCTSGARAGGSDAGRRHGIAWERAAATIVAAFPFAASQPGPGYRRNQPGLRNLVIGHGGTDGAVLCHGLVVSSHRRSAGFVLRFRRRWRMLRDALLPAATPMAHTVPNRCSPCIC